jgi:hypothetical protein
MDFDRSCKTLGGATLDNKITLINQQGLRWNAVLNRG